MGQLPPADTFRRASRTPRLSPSPGLGVEVGRHGGRRHRDRDRQRPLRRRLRDRRHWLRHGSEAAARARSNRAADRALGGPLHPARSRSSRRPQPPPLPRTELRVHRTHPRRGTASVDALQLHVRWPTQPRLRRSKHLRHEMLQSSPRPRPHQLAVPRGLRARTTRACARSRRRSFERSRRPAQRAGRHTEGCRACHGRRGGRPHPRARTVRDTALGPPRLRKNRCSLPASWIATCT